MATESFFRVVELSEKGAEQFYEIMMNEPKKIEKSEIELVENSEEIKEFCQKLKEKYNLQL